MLSEARAILEESSNTDITQGSIFINAYAEDYIDCVNHGLLITARCDIANAKVNKYSYLPVVGYKEWLSVDFIDLILNRVRGNAKNSMIASFKAIGGTEKTLNTYGVDKVLDKFVTNTSDKKQADFLSKCKAFKVVSSCDKLRADENKSKELFSLYKKDASRIIAELINQNLSGYYFIDDICGDGPHVVLLREIHHLPYNTAYALKMGTKIANDKIKYMDGDDISYTIGVISSPYIEHIMQKFSEIFIRIGIENPKEGALEQLVKGALDE